MADFCPNCQAMNDRLVAALEEKDAQVSIASKTEKARAGLSALLAGQQNRDARNGTVREVLEHWQLATGSERKKIPMDGKRAQHVRARLKDFTVEDLKLSAEGYGHFPNVHNKQRVAEGGNRYDDAELIFRDETTVENGLKLLERWKGGDVAPKLQAVPTQQGRMLSPLDRAVKALCDEFGPEAVLPIWETDGGGYMQLAGYWSRCPIEPGLGWPMRLASKWERQGGRVTVPSTLDLGCGHPHSEADLFDALRAIELRWDRRRAEAVSAARAAA